MKCHGRIVREVFQTDAYLTWSLCYVSMRVNEFKYLLGLQRKERKKERK